MPNKKNAEKALRQSKKKQKRNDKIRLSMYDIKRKIRKAVESEASVEELSKLFKEAQIILDKAAKKNIIKKNSASRKKSSIAKVLNKKSTGEKTEKKPVKKSTKKPATKKSPAKKTVKK